VDTGEHVRKDLIGETEGLGDGGLKQAQDKRAQSLVAMEKGNTKKTTVYVTGRLHRETSPGVVRGGIR